MTWLDRHPDIVCPFKQSIPNIHPHVYFYLKEVLNQSPIDLAQCYPYFKSHLAKLMRKRLAIAHLLQPTVVSDVTRYIARNEGFYLLGETCSDLKQWYIFQIFQFSFRRYCSLHDKQIQHERGSHLTMLISGTLSPAKDFLHLVRLAQYLFLVLPCWVSVFYPLIKKTKNKNTTCTFACSML